MAFTRRLPLGSLLPKPTILHQFRFDTLKLTFLLVLRIAALSVGLPLGLLSIIACVRSVQTPAVRQNGAGA